MSIYEDCLKDINIAKDSIKQSLLRRYVDVDSLWCDLYCLPSYNNQTYYCEIYKKDTDVFIIYAKTEVYMHEICAYHKERSFVEAFDKRKNIPPSKIICGIVKASNKFVTNLKEYINAINPTIKYNHELHIIIDGIIQGIRVFDTKALKLEAFYNNLYPEKGNIYISKKWKILAETFYNIVNEEIKINDYN